MPDDGGVIVSDGYDLTAVMPGDAVQTFTVCDYAVTVTRYGVHSKYMGNSDGNYDSHWQRKCAEACYYDLRFSLASAPAYPGGYVGQTLSDFEGGVLVDESVYYAGYGP